MFVKFNQPFQIIVFFFLVIIIIIFFFFPFSISSEFLGLMKNVTKAPLVMEVLNIPGVYKSLERLADLLGKIQKARGESLE